MFMCDSAQVQAEEQEVAEVHIITDEDFELLHITHDDYHIDTCLLVSQEDAERLMKIAVVEDFTNIESQASVMAVILNRVESPEKGQKERVRLWVEYIARNVYAQRLLEVAKDSDNEDVQLATEFLIRMKERKNGKNKHTS